MIEKNGKILIETAVTDSFSMDYFSFGNGAKTLVILPGLSAQSVMISADAIASAYSIMADDFTVYVFDRRKELPPDYTVDDMAKDGAAAILSAGLSRVSIFGASQGGMIAMKIAASHPELVEKLVLGSTAARVTDEGFKVIGKWLGFAERGDAEGLYLSFGEDVYPREVFGSLCPLLIEAAKTVTNDDLARFAALSRGTAGFDATGDLSRISCPVLAIGDSDDRVLGAAATEEIGSFIKNRKDFEMYIYSGYGHAAYDTAPDYKERMLKFLLR